MTVEDADIWRYMQIAQISDFVLSLPDQLDSHVGEVVQSYQEAKGSDCPLRAL